MAEQAEIAFISTFSAALARLPLTYPNDYQQPPALSLKKVPIVPIDLPPPPKRARKEETTVASGSITLTIKSLKPPASFSLSASPADPISTLKSKLASLPRAPPADAQRLLLKGKALADAKLLQEYAVKDADVINLVLKPGFDWDPSAPPTPKDTEMATGAPPMITKTDLSADNANPKPTKGRGHARIPSVVLSPSPSGTSPTGGEDKPADIPLTFDTSAIPTASVSSGPPRSHYHATISDPAFWERLHAFLQAQFPKPADAADAFEDFLNSSKGALTPNEIAKIRDQVGITGMAGR